MGSPSAVQIFLHRSRQPSAPYLPYILPALHPPKLMHLKSSNGREAVKSTEYSSRTKKTLVDKKRNAKDLAAVINKAKKEIDSTKKVLEEMRAERIAEEG